MEIFEYDDLKREEQSERSVKGYLVSDGLGLDYSFLSICIAPSETVDVTFKFQVVVYILR